MQWHHPDTLKQWLRIFTLPSNASRTDSGIDFGEGQRRKDSGIDFGEGTKSSFTSKKSTTSGATGVLETRRCYRTTQGISNRTLLRANTGDLLPSTGISAINTTTVINTTWSGHLHLLGPLRSFPYPELLIIPIIATEAKHRRCQ